MSKGLEKRKLASDVLDFLDDGADNVLKENEVVRIAVEQLVPFHEHPFKLYEGQRLDDMVESIKEHGIMIPILVREHKDKYEILSGHNRLNAAVMAGLKEVPAIIKVGLTEKEAYTYVIETNLIQRGFSELLPSEQAAALAVEYDKVISQGKRNDIIREIEKLSGIESTFGQTDQKMNSRDSISNEYGMSGSKMARMLRINHLVQQFKDMVDMNAIAKGAYFHISFLPEEKQLWVFRAVDEYGYKISEDIAKMFRESEEMLTEQYVMDTVNDLINGKKKEKKFQSVKLDTTVYHRYFSEVEPKEAVSIIEKALDMYFASK